MKSVQRKQMWLMPVLFTALVASGSCVGLWGGRGELEPQQPVFDGGINVSNATPQAGQAVSLSVSASDPQGQTLTYSWDDGNPAAGTFFGAGSAVTWTTDSAGTYNFTCTVSDPDGNSASTTFDLTVSQGTGGGDNQAPAFVDGDGNPLTLRGDVTNPVATQTIRFSAIATDPDGDELSYSWSASGGGTFSGETVNEAGVASVLWAADTAGSYTVTVTADDGKGGSAWVSAVVALTSAEFDVAAFPEDFEFSGTESCANCHGGILGTWQETGHATIEDRMQEAGRGRLESCRECHTVGWNEGGYISYETTPQFANVQCESCHGAWDGGAGAGHMPVSFDPAICGSCHTDEHHPTFDNWQESGHAQIDVSAGNATNPSCVRCHTGDWYVEIQIHGGEPPAEALDPAVNPGMPIVCATCHDPHDNTNESQLRVSSVGSINLAFNDTPVEAGKGNLCISCHDGRRTEGDRDGHIVNGSGHFGPHQNAQGPVLFGVSGYEFEGYDINTTHFHSTIENTCITCHMRQADFSDLAPAVTGHSFVPVYEACEQCHGSVEQVTTLMDAYQVEIAQLLADFVDAWPAEWKDVSDPANPELRNKPSGDGLTDGPPVDDPLGNQYRQALWNYFLVIDDGSFGVHNPAYVRDLLEASTGTVNELNAM